MDWYTAFLATDFDAMDFDTLKNVFEGQQKDMEHRLYFYNAAHLIREHGAEGKQYLLTMLLETQLSEKQLQAAISALGNLPGESPMIVRLTEDEVRRIQPHLFAALNSESELVVATVLQALRSYKIRGASACAHKLLKSTDFGVRETALEYLAEVNGKRSLKTLLKGLEDPSEIVQDTTIDLLVTLEDPQVIPFIEPFLNSDYPMLRETAEGAIHSIKLHDEIMKLIGKD